ncbi:MAG: rhomboid family intramembrane serine protease [Chitinophagaceae bacterium]|nr:MAG: rhomboid family intramembrane serine protease [Chitinophagaceae bacterium]
MLPIGDDNLGRIRTPFVNYGLVLLNIFVFLYWQRLGADVPVTYGFATVPAEILSGHDIVSESRIVVDPVSGVQQLMPGLQPSPYPIYLTLFTALFLHGGIAHIFGNMLYLAIFGDNLENVMGHLRYLAFYLLCGVVASLAHVAATVFFGQNPYVPSLGASGAISGVLGGYLLLFPNHRIRIWFILGFWPFPAWLCVGLWFLFQLINGAGALGSDAGSGVAYAAHIGGFVAGLLLVKLFVHPGDLALYRERREYSLRRRSRIV